MTEQLQAMISARGIYGQLVKILDATHPCLRNLKTSHWEMGLDWYMTMRRASVSHLDDDDPARDESKWVPDPADMVLGYCITVTGGGGEPRLVSSEEVSCSNEDLRRP